MGSAGVWAEYSDMGVMVGVSVVKWVDCSEAGTTMLK
jgi:hypothetical protein